MGKGSYSRVCQSTFAYSYSRVALHLDFSARRRVKRQFGCVSECSMGRRELVGFENIGRTRNQAAKVGTTTRDDGGAPTKIAL